MINRFKRKYVVELKQLGKIGDVPVMKFIHGNKVEGYLARYVLEL